MARKLNLEAFELRRKLFNLANEFKSLQMAADNAGQHDAAGQIDSAACQLAELHGSLGDVFIDAARDDKDQSCNVAL